MQRQGITALAVIVAIALAAGLFLSRGGKGRATDAGASDARSFADDSLGIRLRLPDAPGWSLRREPRGAADGRVVTAIHEGGAATVRVILLPAADGDDLQRVFQRRQASFAEVFRVPELASVVARVIRDETQPIDGRPFRQWQAITRPIEVSGEPPAAVCFMWEMTLEPRHSVEVLGLVRLPAQPDADQRAAAERLVAEVAYILQSFELRDVR